MRFFMLAGLLATSVNAAALPKDANCAATSTVTPAPITRTEESYHNVYYTTSTVTRWALPTGKSAAAASASPAPTGTISNTTAPAQQKAKRACAGAQTVTAEPSTTTVTKTYTRTLAARETQTVAACQPDTDYGLFKGSLSMRAFRGPLPSTQSFPDMTIEQCCQACFTSDAGCMAWSFDGSVSNGDAQKGCTMSMMDTCPSASGTQTSVYPNEEKPVVGAGPCLVEM